MTKIILVTGGNRGIGLEVCKQLAQQGHTVLLGSRELSKGQQAAQTIKSPNIHPVQLDVTNEVDRQAVFKHIKQTYGRLDVLVNNAGIFPDKVHQLLQTDLALMRHTMEVNSWAPLHLMQLFIPLMRQHNWGRVVNVSSGIGELGDLGSSYPTYRFSKINLNLITRIVAQEVAGTDIKVNAMTPGWVQTDMGGANAPRTVEEGADTIVWLATLPDDGPHGGYFRDRQPIEW